MTDVWSGDLLLPDNSTIKEIVLATQNIASATAIPTTPLRFLSTVDTARIPLYLAAGPSLDVWTTSEDTQVWFDSILLGKCSSSVDASTNAGARQWWHCMRSQSPIGIIAQVEGAPIDAKSPRITEILFYGTVAAPAHGKLPTPPSSSPVLSYTEPGTLPELRVHALPLSSDLLYQPCLSDVSPLSPPLNASEPPPEHEPHFLPSPFALIPAIAESPKRKRDIFEEATQLRTKARRKGGEDVAAAAAKASDSRTSTTHRKSLSIDTKASPFPDFRPASASAVLSRPPSRQLSRSPSISSDTRPLSRKGLPDGHTKRSNLSRVATVSLQPEEPTVETRNKEALSKVVMAAMRMHGLQQRRKNRSRRASVAPDVQMMEEQAGAEEAVKDEEYKLIYHQTYKGAALALRKHITSKPLHLQPDRLRDVVEQLLSIFCTDPLTQPLSTEEPSLLLTPGIPGSRHSETNPFDMPSGSRMAAARLSENHQLNTGSPISKRKGDNNRPEPT